MKVKLIVSLILCMSLFLSGFNFTKDNFGDLLKSIKAADVKNIQIVNYSGEGTAITNFKVNDIKEFVKTLNDYISYTKKPYPHPKGHPTYIEISMKNDKNSLELSRVNGRLVFYMKDGTYGVEMNEEFNKLMERVGLYPYKFIPNKNVLSPNKQVNSIVPKLQDIDYVEYIKGYVGCGDVLDVTYTFDLSNSYHKKLIYEMLNELTTAKIANPTNDYISAGYSPPKLIIKLKNNKSIGIQGPCANINNIVYVSDGSNAICLVCPKTRIFLDAGWQISQLNHVRTNSQLINFVYKSIHMKTIPDKLKYLDNIYIIGGIVDKSDIDKMIGATSDGYNFTVFSLKDTLTNSAIAILGNEKNPEIYIEANIENNGK